MKLCYITGLDQETHCYISVTSAAQQSVSVRIKYCVKFWAFQHILEKGWAEAWESEEDGAPEKEELGQQVLFTLEIRRKPFTYLQGDCREDETKLPLEMHIRRAIGRSHKLWIFTACK